MLFADNSIQIVLEAVADGEERSPTHIYLEQFFTLFLLALLITFEAFASSLLVRIVLVQARLTERISLSLVSTDWPILACH